MSKLHKTESLLEWEGDVDSMILEMKRRAGLTTDAQLADMIGMSQAGVANWRRRGAVPESAILRFEQSLEDEAQAVGGRAMWARALAMRLAEYDFERLKNSGTAATKMVVYGIHAGQLDLVADFCFETLKGVEKEYGVTTDVAASLLIENDKFYADLSKLAEALPLYQVLERQRVSELNAARHHYHGRPVRKPD